MRKQLENNKKSMRKQLENNWKTIRKQFYNNWKTMRRRNCSLHEPPSAGILVMGAIFDRVKNLRRANLMRTKGEANLTRTKRISKSDEEKKEKQKVRSK